MPVYHQMGHHSENLLNVMELSTYRGAILSPVNYAPSEVRDQIAPARERSFETLFDPQLYFPNSERGLLREWPYFPSDVDTADLSSAEWWKAMTASLVDVCAELGPTAVCSPAVVPRAYTDEYFVRLVETATVMREQLRDKASVAPIQTALVGLGEVSTPGRAMAIASVISKTQCDRVYLVFIGNTDPRRELRDVEELKGAMRLISALRQAGLDLIVGFTSSEIVLWKAAGANSCATGKFFNLRRFTSSRFEEPTQGGGQLPYWTEEALLAFLRESDVLRVKDQNLLSDASLRNPFCQQILAQFDSRPGGAWVSLGWRQFMYWFSDIESRIASGSISVRDLLKNAESNWMALEDADVLMEERRNDGAWIRSWRRALSEYKSH